MRAALHGLSIVTPSWIRECLRLDAITSPKNGPWIVRTLPPHISSLLDHYDEDEDDENNDSHRRRR